MDIKKHLKDTEERIAERLKDLTQAVKQVDGGNTAAYRQMWNNHAQKIEGEIQKLQMELEALDE